jgi:hypothetical protein
LASTILQRADDCGPSGPDFVVFLLLSWILTDHEVNLIDRMGEQRDGCLVECLLSCHASKYLIPAQ